MTTFKLEAEASAVSRELVKLGIAVETRVRVIVLVPYGEKLLSMSAFTEQG